MARGSLAVGTHTLETAIQAECGGLWVGATSARKMRTYMAIFLLSAASSPSLLSRRAPLCFSMRSE